MHEARQLHTHPLCLRRKHCYWAQGVLGTGIPVDRIWSASLDSSKAIALESSR
jgi:hypothetical protein